MEAPAELNIRHVIREDAQLLFGFSDADSLRLFDLLTGVSGVGPKLGLALLSAMPVSALAQGLLTGDVKLLSSVSGVGKKTAERLVIELRDRAGAATAAGAPGGASAQAPASPLHEARAALEALGYKPAEAQRLTDAANAPDLSAEQIIREALRRAVR